MQKIGALLKLSSGNGILIKKELKRNSILKRWKMLVDRQLRIVRK
jgi:hypothetical protein